MRQIVKVMLLSVFLMTALGSPRLQADEPPKTLHHDLYRYAKKICNVPEDMPKIVMVYMEWFVMQVFYPEFAKTFTSMYNGMNNLSSRSGPYAVCVGKFISIPKNETWEPFLDLNKKAHELNVHPPVVLKVVYEDGSFDVAVNPHY